MLVSAMYITFTVLGQPSTVPVRCDANSNVARNCYEEFKGALPNVFRSESEPDRAKTVGEAVKNCWNCATETLTHQLRDFGTEDADNSRN
jgi:hypothetical protein